MEQLNNSTVLTNSFLPDLHTFRHSVELLMLRAVGTVYLDIKFEYYSLFELDYLHIISLASSFTKKFVPGDEIMWIIS